MHYILNTVFRTPGGITNKKIGGPTRFGEKQPQVQLNVPKNLKPGELYTLVYIKKIKKGVEYQFKNSSGEIIGMVFSDCLEADEFIAKMRNEKLPDYKDFYSRNNT